MTTNGATKADGLDVHRAIAEIKAQLAAGGGITKNREADLGGRSKYMFRGIDDMYNVLCGLTAARGLNLYPRTVARERQVLPRYRDGNQIGHTVHVFQTTEIEAVSAHDGSKQIMSFDSEGNDTSDKATNKASSAAFKYACIQAFMIPTHGESVDSEQEHVPVAPPAQSPHMPNLPPPVTGGQMQNTPQQAPANERTEPAKRTRRPKENPSHQEAVAPNPPPVYPAGQVAQQVTTLVEPANNQTIAEVVMPAKSLAIGIQAAPTFESLMEFATRANAIAEPDRGGLFGCIRERIADLCSASKTVDELRKSRDLIKSLGASDALLTIYNQNYERLTRAAQQPGFAG